jgi:integrase/recombinase XerD
VGLRLGDLRFGEWRVFIAEGKGGHQRLVPVSPRFFTEVGAYLDAERPAAAGTRCGVHRAEGLAPRAAAERGGAG